MRVLGYCCNGRGFGHVTRVSTLLTAIREELKTRGTALDSYIDIALLTEADTLWPSQYFRLPLIKLPSNTFILGGADNEQRVKKTRGLIRQISTSIIKAFSPDILLLDTLLAGSYEEFLDGEILSSTYTVFINRERKASALDSSVENRLPLPTSTT